jgi:hypothetical protein
VDSGSGSARVPVRTTSVRTKGERIFENSSDFHTQIDAFGTIILKALNFGALRTKALNSKKFLKNLLDLLANRL